MAEKIICIVGALISAIGIWYILTSNIWLGGILLIFGLVLCGIGMK